VLPQLLRGELWGKTLLRGAHPAAMPTGCYPLRAAGRASGPGWTGAGGLQTSGIPTGLSESELRTSGVPAGFGEGGLQASGISVGMCEGGLQMSGIP